MIPVASCLLVLFLVACGSGAPGGGDTVQVVSSDPELAATAQRLLPELARRSGLSLQAPVRLERKSRAELEDYLRLKLDEEVPPELARRIVEAYALLGLVPPETDVRSLLLSVYQEQVIGFYEPDSTALFVVDDQPVSALEPVLVHELVHAVQDQTAPLDSLTHPSRGNDRQVAAQAAIEGHATLVMLELMLERAQGGEVDLGQIPDLSGTLDPVLESARSQYPALAEAPRVLQEGLLFPYLQGAGFVLEVWRSRPGRPAPFGRLLPESTEQVMDPARLLGSAPDSPVELSVEGPVAPAYQNALGKLELEIFLEQHLGTPGRALAEGWAGDRFALFAGDAPSLVWVSVWDDRSSRDRFVRGLVGGLHRLPQPAGLRALEISGLPGAEVRIGAPPDVVLSVVSR